MNATNLTQPELAAIYRRLNPGKTYLGDPPERWFRDILVRFIRQSLSEQP